MTRVSAHTHTHTHPHTHTQSELLEHSLRHISESSISTGVEMTDYHSNSLKGGSAPVIEHLQSLLKQKEGELSTAQVTIVIIHYDVDR